jgi:hypothetical protein
MIRIYFSDIDWIDSQGRILKMSLENDMNTNARLSYNYVAPVITEDSWKGRTFPVQKNIWESYKIQFAIKEVATHMLAKMQACRDIRIVDTETKESIIVDTQSNGSISLEVGNRYDTNQYYNLIVNCNKIKLYPGISVNHTNTLKITIGLLTYDFYTDFEIIDFVTDPVPAKYTNNKGLDIYTKTNSKNGKMMLFYFFEADAISLKLKCENLGFSSIVINPATDNIQVAEIGKVKLSTLSEGLYRCEAEFIISPNQNFAQ